MSSFVSVPRGLMVIGILTAVVALLTQPASAALIFLTGQKEPLKAIIDKQNDAELVVRLLQTDGSYRKRRIDRLDVELIVPTVKVDRLTALHPDRPELYRDYAEELAAKKQDPEAREAGIRLYLIAAYLKPKELGLSSLLGMVGLSRSEKEQRIFRAMAFLLDPSHDRSLLKTPPKKQAPPSTARAPKTPTRRTSADRSKAANPHRELLRVLPILRMKDAAAKHHFTAGKMDFERLLKGHEHILSPEEFAMAASLDSPLPPELLAKVASLELALRGGPPRVGVDSPDLAVKTSSTAWSTLVANGRHAPAPSLTLETCTEFDPRLTLYREGKWVAVDK